MWDNEQRNADADEAAGAVSFDPFADLLLGLIAIIVPIISLLLASGHGLTAVEEKPAAVQSSEGSYVIVANAGGLVLPAQNGSRAPLKIALGQILDDSELVRVLRERRDLREPFSLRIEPDGLESAFLFETVAAQNGPETFHQIRVGGVGSRDKNTRAGDAR